MPPRKPTDLAEIVTKRMTALDLTAYQLAKVTGIPQQSILNFTRHGRAMNSDNLAKILDALDLVVIPREKKE